MSISTKFSQKLFAIRQEKNWPIERMAGYCDLTPGYYRELELGKHIPMLDTALRIAKEFNFSLDDFKEDL